MLVDADLRPTAVSAATFLTLVSPMLGAPFFFFPAESSSTPQAFEGQSSVLVRSTVGTMDGTLCTAKGCAGDRLALSRRRASKVLGREKPDLHLSVFSPMMMIHAMLFYVSSTLSVKHLLFFTFCFFR